MKTRLEATVVKPDWTHARWRKSSQSGGNGNCVEFTTSGEVVGVRDSKDPEGPVLEFAAARWNEFLASIKDGEFDTL